MSWLIEKMDGVSVLGVIIGVILVLGLLFGLFCLEAWVAMLLWNACLVGAIGVAEVGFWPMAGIVVLFNILFKTTIPSTKKD